MTIGEAVRQALDAYDALEQLGDEVEDEWQYVTDLAETHRLALAAIAEREGSREVSPDAAAAIDEAIVEIGLIEDPHRAIDWLSTFPYVVSLALGEPLWAEAQV